MPALGSGGLVLSKEDFIMKSNKLLTILVIILTIGLITQSAYLWKIQSDQKSKNYKTHDLRKADKKFDSKAEKIRSHQQALSGASAAGSFDPFTFSFQSSFDQYDPFYEMEQIQQRMNRMFRDSFSRATSFSKPGFFEQHTFYEPEIDVDESNTHYVVKIDLPGMEKDQINVEVRDHFLVISGNRKTESEETDEHGNFYRAERSFGSFSRAVPLPADANQDDISAEYKNGVLVVKIAKIVPQAEEKKEKPKIEVK